MKNYRPVSILSFTDPNTTSTMYSGFVILQTRLMLELASGSRVEAGNRGVWTCGIPQNRLTLKLLILWKPQWCMWFITWPLGVEGLESSVLCTHPQGQWNEHHLLVVTYFSKWGSNLAAWLNVAFCGSCLLYSWSWILNQANVCGANIPGKARLDGTAAKSVFKSKTDEAFL